MKIVALGELLEPAQVKRAGSTELPVLSMTMHEGLVTQSDRFKKRIASLDTSEYKVVKRGQLVVGFPIDEGVLDFQMQHDEAVVSPAYGIWNVRDDTLVDRSYLKLFLTSPRAITYYTGKMKGSTARRRSLPASEFRAMPVPLPTLPEQRRIAAILDRADALRAKRRQVLAHLDALTQSVFTSMFSNENYQLVSAGIVMPRMRNGLSPATAGAHVADVLTLSAVTRGAFDPTAVKSGFFAVDPPADKRVTNNDFLMCRGNGNKDLVGVGTYSPIDHPELVFPDTVIAGTIDPTLVDMQFLETAWKRPEVRVQIRAVARTTNGTFKVNQKTLAGVQLAVPPLDLQHAFAKRAEVVHTQEDAVRRSLAADDELFASLQSRAFRGEL